MIGFTRRRIRRETLVILPGQRQIHRRAMIEILVRHRLHDRKPMRELRQSRQMLAEESAGDGGLDCSELAAHFQRRIGTRIERLKLTLSAAGKDNKHRLRAAEPRSRAAILGVVRRRRVMSLNRPLPQYLTEKGEARAARHIQPLAPPHRSSPVSTTIIRRRDRERGSWRTRLSSFSTVVWEARTVWIFTARIGIIRREPAAEISVRSSAGSADTS